MNLELEWLPESPGDLPVSTFPSTGVAGVQSLEFYTGALYLLNHFCSRHPNFLIHV